MIIVSKTKNMIRDCISSLFSLSQWVITWRSVPVWSWIRAANYFKESEFRSAAACYEVGLSKYSDHPASGAALVDLAFCRLMLGDLEKAFLDIEASFARSPSKETALFFMKVLRFMGQVERGSSFARVSVGRWGKDPIVVAAAAHLAIWASDSPNDVCDVFELVQRLRGSVSVGSIEDTSLCAAIARYEMKFGDSKKAERLLARILAGDYSPYEAILLRAQLFFEQRRFIQAHQLYTRALTRHVEDPRPWAGISVCYLSAETSADARCAVDTSKLAVQKSCAGDVEILRIAQRASGAVGNSVAEDLFAARAGMLEAANEIDIKAIYRARDQINRLQYL